MNEVISYGWLNPLVDEVQAVFTEHEFNARWTIIEGHHKVGEMLREAEKAHEMNITELVRVCATEGNMSERKLWYSVKFYDTFPVLALLPEGKDVSFSKIRKKYLTESTDSEEEERFIICPHCGERIKL
jgi:hypothetical protein